MKCDCVFRGLPCQNEGAVYVKPFLVPWEELGELENVIPKNDKGRCATCVWRDKYPDTEWEWAMKIPTISTIQPAFMNGWGGGEAVTLYPMYFLNDDAGGDQQHLRMGTTVLTMGMQGASNATQWVHTFLKFPYGRLGGLDTVKGIKVYVRKRPYPWVKAGTMKDVQAIRKKYNSLTYDLATSYNGEIQQVFFNGWNRGTRMNLYPWYPQGANQHSMQFGAALFTQGVPPESLGQKRWRHTYGTAYHPALFSKAQVNFVRLAAC